MTKLYRSQRDKKLFGLCGGLAETFNIDATLLRLVVVVTAFFSAGTTILLYLLACMVIPKESGYVSEFAHAGTSSAQHNTGSSQFQQESSSSNIDEMMKDIEKKAMWKEIEELRAKVAKYEKGDV
jgi:phage shock protein C